MARNVREDRTGFKAQSFTMDGLKINILTVIWNHYMCHKAQKHLICWKFISICHRKCFQKKSGTNYDKHVYHNCKLLHRKCV